MRTASAITIALIGNSGSGKTTLFNKLTQQEKISRPHSNIRFSVKKAPLQRAFAEKNVWLIDLPGIHSLSPQEKTTAEVLRILKHEPIDVIVNVVDATNLERDLFLTLSLLSIGVPVVVAFNMMDEIHKEHIALDIPFIKQKLGVSMIPISAAHGKGMESLIQSCLSVHHIPTPIIFSNRREADQIIHGILVKAKKEIKQKPSFPDRVDSIICNPVAGIPLFLVVMSLVFFFTFSSIGSCLSLWLAEKFMEFSDKLHNILYHFGVSEWLRAWVVEGVWRGISSVLAFIPQTVIFFFLLDALKESGYLARAALVMDDFLRYFGISGKATSPLLVGFGCAVSAVTETETQEDTEKEITLAALPFIPCGSRLSVILLVASEFFEANSTVFAISLYFVCLGAALFSVLLFRHKNHREAPPLIMELPKYRIPRFTNLLREAKRKIKDFLIRAGTYVLLSCVVVNLLAMITPQLQPTMNFEESILVLLGEAASPLFSILGFADGKLIAALASGFFTKESIVSTVRILMPGGLSTSLSKASAVSFSVFSLLYTPCAATLLSIRRELGTKKTLLLWIRTFIIAFIFAYTSYNLSRLL